MNRPYDEMSVEEKNLADEIVDMFCHSTGEAWTNEQVADFMKKLDELGIDTSDKLEDSFLYRADYVEGDSAKNKFAKYWFVEVCKLNRSSRLDVVESGVKSSAKNQRLTVDWEQAYYEIMENDMNYFSFEGDTFFFANSLRDYA